jgi:transporter family-2 protein
MTWILFLAALAAGIANPFQSGINGELSKQLGQPLWAAVLVYTSGLAVVILLVVFGRHPFPGDKLPTVSWWAFLGGAVSVLSTVIAIIIVQRLGSALFTGASVTAALVTSVLLDHFGLIGFRQHAASPARIAGCALMIAGLWVIARF